MSEATPYQEAIGAALALQREVAGLKERLAQAELERDEAQGNYRFMVERAANEKLDGYRELGARAAAAENARDDMERQRDAAVELLREVRKEVGPTDNADDARSYVAEVALGISHYPHEKGEPCVRCERDWLRGEVARLSGQEMGR